jgi:multiple sugar transport system ATP-binding protein
MTNLQLDHISKRFRSTVALDGVTFDVADGEFFVLLGPTGAGKTTTLRIIAGLEKQGTGSVLFDGELMNGKGPAERDVAFVFQQYSLYPTMTVYDNLAFPLRSPLRRMPESQIKELVEKTAVILRITHLLDRKTAHLSGGEMQRVSIGRAIVRQPRLFLMDEPLSNLDAKLREALRVELQHIQKEQGSTTLFVTHDQVEALTMADRIAVLNEGQIVQIGSATDIYDHPATTFVAQLVGTPRINLMDALREDGSIMVKESTISVDISDRRESMPAECLLGVRPEDIHPTSNGAYRGEIALVEPLGVETILHIRSGGRTILSSVTGMSDWQLGQNIQFDIVHDRLHFFDKKGQRVTSGK